MTRFASFTALSVCFCFAIQAPVTRAAEAGTTKASEAAQHLKDDYNRFGFKLFQKISIADSAHSVFISPASAAFALAMLYNGAAGTTREELANLLGLGGLTLQEDNEANATLLAKLGQADSTVELAVANSIWCRNTFQFRQDFLERTRKFYSAKVSALDFNDPASPGVINEWVRESTRDKISKMIDRISPDDVMFLINAVYFKGMWSYPFSKELTTGRPFHCLDGTTKEVPMMQQTREFGYMATESFQAIRLPYGKGSCSMLLLLPASDYGLERFVADITPQKWTEWGTQIRSQEVHIVMPRFNLKYERFLNEPLMALGMKSAFDPGSADLTGLWDPPKDRSFNLFVSYVRQKTFVEVNEEGTEAAAVTDIGIKVTSMPPPPVEMLVDRPFFCAIVDDATSLILFMGAIVDPAEAGPSD